MLHKMAARTLSSCGYREIPSFSALIKFNPHSIDYDVSNRFSHVATKTEDLETKEYSALVKFAWLGQLARGISVKGDNVKVYTEPEDYYELVKVFTLVFIYACNACVSTCSHVVALYVCMQVHVCRLMLMHVCLRIFLRNECPLLALEFKWRPCTSEQVVWSRHWHRR